MPAGRTLVIQTAHLGDVVLTLPLLMRLAERHGPVDVVTTPAATPLLSPHPAVRRAIPFDKHGADRGPAGLLRLAAVLRRTGYARVLVPHESLRSGLLAWLAGARARTGYSQSASGLLCTERLNRPAGTHASVRLAALAGAGPPPEPPWLFPTGEEQGAAGRWLDQQGVPTGFVLVAPGSRWGSKRWPFYDRLAAAWPEPIVVLGGPEDRALGDAIVAAAPGRAWNAAGALGLRASAALVERAALLVTNDSFPLHLASALGRPAIALFGPTVPAFGFGPLGRGLVVEVGELPCRPCSPHGPPTCPLGHHRCLRDLSVESVLAAVRTIRR